MSGKVIFEADGIAGRIILEAKFVYDPEHSSFVEGSKVKDTIREIIRLKEERKFIKMAQIVADESNPLTEVEVIVNNPAANRYFIDLMLKAGLNGKVTNR